VLLKRLQTLVVGIKSLAGCYQSDDQLPCLPCHAKRLLSFRAYARQAPSRSCEVNTVACTAGCPAA